MRVAVIGTGTADDPRRPDLPEGATFTIVADNGPTMEVEYDDPAESEAIKLAARIALVPQVKAGDLDDETIAQVAAVFPDWEPNIPVQTGWVYRWDGTLVECLQPHTTAAEWEPGPATAALWKIHRTAGSVDVWVQPGSTNGYMIGERVLYPDAQGATYESLINDNVWSPVAYPAGWSVV